MNVKTIIESYIKVLAIVLALAVILPSAIKLSHAFNHHTHEVCENDNNADEHFHEADLDCDFYKFKLTNQYYVSLTSQDLISFDNNYKITVSQYHFVSDFQRLQTALRGPPQLI